jgi:transposase
VSVGTVGACLARARQAGLSWAEVESLRDSELDGRLYGAPQAAKRPLPDFADIHRELHRAGVTLQLLHVEYLEQHSDGYGYTQFCRYYKRWLSKQQRSMRQIHRAGEKLFVDYSGKKPHIVDPQTGELQEVELFVAALGASSCSFAEATRTQQSADFLASHVRAFEYFGGVTEAVVPDQLKSAVTRACRYEPGIQRDYAQLAEHYDTVILPSQGDLLLARRTEPPHRGASRGAQPQDHARLRSKSSRAVRAARPADSQAPAARALQPWRVEARQGQHRLPRRG